LAFREPTTFAVTSTVDVSFGGEPLANLNELECVDGVVYANALGDDNIYEIDPATGEVTGVIDASELEPTADRAGGDVLNGIAHDPTTDRFYITGKNWSTLYEVTFEPVD
jgi:glutaminyl-peptide cyclotransferase